MYLIFELAIFCSFLANSEVVTTEKPSNVMGNKTAFPSRPKLYQGDNKRFKPAISGYNTTQPPNSTPKTTLVFRPVTACRGGKSCGGRCSPNRQFQNASEVFPTCFCDPFCDTVFHDCCADYDKECNATAMKEKAPKTKLDDLWKCTKIRSGKFSIWMISKCHSTWKNAEIAEKCTTPDKRQISTQIPVIDNNNLTFQNRYCAICNGIQEYKPWDFEVKCSVISPRGYTEAESWQFTDFFCRSEFLKRKFSSRGIRYCYDITKECKRETINEEYDRGCAHGPTGLVTFMYQTYRNLDCFICNYGFWFFPTCGPELTLGKDMEMKFPRPYSAIFTSSTGNSFTSYSRCPALYKYDARSGNCRNQALFKADIENNNQQLLQQYSVILQYRASVNQSCNTSAKQVQTRFNYVFEKLLQVSIMELKLKYSDLGVYKQNSSFVVTFQLLGLKEESENGEPLYFSKIEELVFHASFYEGLQQGICRYFLTQHTEREMFCVQNASFIAVNTSAILPNGTLFANQTQSYYSKGNFLSYNETFFVVCKDLKPANCSFYSILQNTNDSIPFPNRSIYSHVTKSTFDYGEYSIIGSKVWLCLKNDLVLKANRIETPPVKSIHTTILSYATLVSLTLSIFSLIVVLIVYSINRSLRNLPGKNLMLLCGTLAFAQTLWLIEGNISAHSVLCTAVAIGSHFAFLSSFCTSGSIAIHSFLTFSRLAKGKLYGGNKKRAFLWYCVYSIGLPGAWVTLCWILHSRQVISLRDETVGSCWLNSDGLKIAFFYPALTQLLLNIILLIATLRYIQKCSKASRKLQEKNGTTTTERCVGIYLRMSTLMGLSWLFGVFVVVFPNVVVFEYFFVFGNGFQGLYIALAFLLTKNVKKIMAQKLSKSSTSTSQLVQSSI